MRRLRRHAVAAAAKALVPISVGAATVIGLTTPHAVTGRLDGPPENIPVGEQQVGIPRLGCPILYTRAGSRYLQIHNLRIEPRTDFEPADEQACANRGNMPLCDAVQISPTDGCALPLRFSPAELGPRRAELLDLDPKTSEPTTIAILNGIGTAERAPDCSLSVEPAVIAPGESATLYWTAQNGLTLSLTGFDEVLNIGTQPVTPDSSRSYTLTAKKGEATVCTSQVTVSVVPPGAERGALPEIISFDQGAACNAIPASPRDPDTILCYEAKRAETAMIQPDPNPGRKLHADRDQIPVHRPTNQPVHYRLTVSDGLGGHDSREAIVFPPLALPQISSFTTCSEPRESDRRTIVDLCYEVENATAVALAPSTTTHLSTDRDRIRVTLSDHPVTYTLTAIGTGGEATSSVTVGPPSAVVAPVIPEIKRFEARTSGTCFPVAPAVAVPREHSDLIDLCYEVEGADQVEISPYAGSVRLDPRQGHLQFIPQPEHPTVYTLHARSRTGHVATAALTLIPAIVQPRVPTFEQSTAEICTGLKLKTFPSDALASSKPVEKPAPTLVLRYVVEGAVRETVTPGFDRPFHDLQACLKIPAVTSATTYVLVATSESGAQSTSEITVNPAHAQILSFKADKTEITQGETVRLDYNTQYAQRLKLNSSQVSPVEKNKPDLTTCALVSPTTTTTYRLQAIGFDGVTSSDDVKVSVLPPPLSARTGHWLKSVFRGPRAAEPQKCP